MRAIKNCLILFAGLFVFATSCEKIEDLPYYDKGTVVTLTPSTTTVTPTPADSTTQVISFSWTDPAYATDTSTYKFILELDSTGRNFSKKITKEVIGKRTVGFTGREINTALLNYGFAIGVPKVVDVRIVSSYGNNNEQYISNVVKVTITPFNDPPKLSSTSDSADCGSHAAPAIWRSAICLRLVKIHLLFPGLKPSGAIPETSIILSNTILPERTSQILKKFRLAIYCTAKE